MQRRKFIKNSCSLCLAAAGASYLLTLLESCSTTALYKTAAVNNKISIPLNEFINTNFLIVRPAEYSYDFAIVKISDKEYKSIIMECTHANNPLRFNGNEFTCNLHGSVFSRTGSVETGPAEKNLIQLRTEISDDHVIIALI